MYVLYRFKDNIYLVLRVFVNVMYIIVINSVNYIFVVCLLVCIVYFV